MGLYAGMGQYKASFHVHTTHSTGDGKALLRDALEEHYTRNFDLVTVTDHNFVTPDWRLPPNGLSAARFDEMEAGAGRGGRPMVMIPNTIEQGPSGGEHTCTFLTNFNVMTTAALLARVEAENGLAHINHIGRTKGRNNVNNQPLIALYEGHFRRYRSCVGMEIINSPLRYGEDNDRIMWDNLNQLTIPQGRTIWGFASDDSHQNDEIDWAFNMLVMPENTEASFRQAMRAGSFYAVTRIAHNEGVNNRDRDRATPLIADIAVNGPQMAILATDYDRIEWVTSTAPGGTRTVAQGDSVDTRDLGNVGSFIRGVVIGPGGVAFTRPFRTHTRRPPYRIAWSVQALLAIKQALGT